MQYTDEEIAAATAIAQSFVDLVDQEIAENAEDGAIDCPACGSDIGTFMGYLGYLAWFRCQRCGTESSVRIEPKEEEER